MALPRQPTADDLEVVEVELLTEHPDNPRTHADEALGRSLDEHGMVDVCVVQRSTGPGYCDVIAARWANLTGETPLLDGTPVTEGLPVLDPRGARGLTA